MSLSPTQKEIFAILSDGLPHTAQELHGCLDELSQVSSVKGHLFKIRQALAPRRETIAVEYIRGRLHYRWMRFITADK